MKNRADLNSEAGEKNFSAAPAISPYVFNLLRPEDHFLRQVRENSQKNDLPRIQLGRFDVRHLEVLVHMSGARSAVEIGTLGGYSGLAIGRAMGPKGKLYTFELNERNSDVAQASFAEARKKGLAIAETQFFLGPALDRLHEVEKHGPFDLVFIDADKANYENYLEWASMHLRIGGVVIADNTFGFGYIHLTQGIPEQERKSVEALQKFNIKMAQDPRFLVTMLPTAEGMTVAVKCS